MITLVLLGKLLEARATRRHVGGARGTRCACSRDAHAFDRGGVTVEFALAEVVAGDRLIVRAGERMPVDGVVSRGQSSVDESMLTGESRRRRQGCRRRRYSRAR